jgi:hypothetical protein
MLVVKYKRFLLSRISILSISTLLLTLFSATAQASSAISIGTTNFGAGIASNVGVTLTGFDQTQNYQVTVKFVNTDTDADVTNGTLAATQSGTTLISGYTLTGYSAAKLGFKGSYSQIATALSTLTWNPLTATGNTSIRIGIATQPGTNEFYDANSGRYYKYVSTGTAWAAARTAAESTYLFGLRGYLAEINTEAENNFIARETTAPNIWMGAIEDTATAANWTGNSYTGAAGQRWIWQGAIETPLPTGSGLAAGNTGNTIAGVFSNWASNEPNNNTKGGTADCGLTNWGTGGQWDDQICTTTNGYLIEFGGRALETSTASITTLTTTVFAQTLTAPAAPTINSVSAGDKRLTIAFTAGATGGSVITDYEYSLNGGAYTSAGTTSSPFTISGLSGRTNYSIALKARNSVGLGSASTVISATTTDSGLDASDAAAAEAARAASAAASAAAKKASEQQELINILALVPKIGELALSLSETTRSLYSTRCVKAKTTKFVKKGAKCPKGFVRRK